MFENVYRENFGGIAVGRVKRDKDFTQALGFFRNEYAIQYVYTGERYFFAEGNCYRMTEGCIAFIDKNKIPKTCIIGGQMHDRLLIELKGEYIAPLCAAMGFDFHSFFSRHYGVYQVAGNACAKRFLEELEQVMQNQNQTYRLTLLVTILVRFFAESKYWEHEKIGQYHGKEAERSALKQRRIHEVADYIAAHYMEIDSVDVLAKQFYMSKSYLCRVFKEVIDFTITEYIHMHRIASSKEYLLDEKYTMTEIANILGYESLTYFERVFRKIMGISPLQYRKKRLGKRKK